MVGNLCAHLFMNRERYFAFQDIVLISQNLATPGWQMDAVYVR